VAVDHKTILIVDDDEPFLHLLWRDLARSGFAVLQATNGRQALEIVRSRAVDIIVSDISMPEMDGWEFCERIRRDPDCGDIPFIFLTVHGGEEKRMRGLRSGADEYLVKPVNVRDLIARVEILYDRVRRKRSANTLTGNLRDVSLCELLQLFEMTRKRGILSVEHPTGQGTLALMDGILLNAAWNNLEAEDAVFEMFALRDGSFRFQPKDVSGGNLAQPISFVLMETARLTDELAALAGHVPAPDVPLRLQKPFGGDDADAQLVSQAIQQGFADGQALHDWLRISDVRLRLALGKLVEGGFVTAGSDPPQADAQKTDDVVATKATKILIAFTDDAMLSRCLSLMVADDDHRVQRTGLSDVSRVVLSSQVYDIFCLRGEKRFAFMWELVLKTADGAVFLLKTDDDHEHANFLAARAASLRKPVVRVCLGTSLSNMAGVQVATTGDDMARAFSSLGTPVT
jgi:CheY-like chemotaxis protein